MKNISQFNKTPYSFEFPVPSTSQCLPTPTSSVKCMGVDYETIEDCVEACKAKCKELGVDYYDNKVKLFMTDSDGKWEVTEEGELAG